jgi:nitrogen regulatory protein P-II 1
VSYLPECKIEGLVADDLVERAVETSRQAARTGRIGDGKIFALEVGSAVRIRTGETGLNAI